MWDILANILQAGLRNDRNIALMALCMALLCAIAYPVISLVAGSGNIVLKLIVLLPFIAYPVFLIVQGWRTGQWLAWWQSWSMWGRCGFIVMIPTGLILITAFLDADIAVAIGLMMSSVSIIVIGVYAFVGRFLYAALVEAPSSGEITVGDAEVPAGTMFRSVLAILAWEWFAAWFFTAFHPQMTIHTATIAFMSFGITAIASYALGVSANKGLRWLMYGSLIVFIAIFAVHIDQALKNPLFVDYLQSGYIGSYIKNNITLKQIFSSMGLIEWIPTIVFLDLLGVTIAWYKQKEWISKATFALLATLITYLLAAWVASTGFSLTDYIAKLTAFFDQDITRLPRDVMVALVSAGIIGAVAGTVGTVHQIIKGWWPLWPIAGFSLASFLLYQLVFVR